MKKQTKPSVYTTTGNRITIEKWGYIHTLVEITNSNRLIGEPCYMGKSGYALQKVEKKINNPN